MYLDALVLRAAALASLSTRRAPPTSVAFVWPGAPVAVESLASVWVPFRTRGFAATRIPKFSAAYASRGVAPPAYGAGLVAIVAALVAVAVAALTYAAPSVPAPEARPKAAPTRATAPEPSPSLRALLSGLEAQIDEELRSVKSPRPAYA